MLSGGTHRRFDPLRREWVLVSPDRSARPWQGQVDRPEADAAAPYDPDCYLCPVLCFSPRQDLPLVRMAVPTIRGVIDAWVGECESLAAVPWMQYAVVFENRGAMMGASNPHPHCQIWGTEHVPNEPARELASLEEYRGRRGSCLLCGYADL